MGRNVTVNLSGISFFLPSMVQDSLLDGPRYFGRYPGPFKTILPRRGPFLGSLRPYGLLDLSARGAWLRSWHTLLSHEVKIFCEEYWKQHLTGLVDGSNVKWGVSSAAPPVQNLSHRISKSVLLSRPDKSGRARISGRYGIMALCLLICPPS